MQQLPLDGLELRLLQGEGNPLWAGLFCPSAAEHQLQAPQI